MSEQQTPQADVTKHFLYDCSNTISTILKSNAVRSVLFVGKVDDPLKQVLMANRFMRFISVTCPEVNPVTTGFILKSLFDTSAASLLKMETFQAVVVSSSMLRYTPHTEWLDSLVLTAWSRVAPGGRLYLLVHNEGVSDWGDLLASASLENPQWDAWHADLLKYLAIGKLRSTRVTIGLTSESYIKLAIRLSHLYAEGDEKKQKSFCANERILSYLSMCKSPRQKSYYMPLEYFILEVTRS